MIIVRSPLRVSLGGGGTDLPSYYHNHSGFVLAAAIDKYVYITVHRRFVKQILLKYSHLEEVDSVAHIKHPIFREALKLFAGSAEGLEITSMADIPAGTGLGSSGSFTTALLKALHALRNNTTQPQELAEQACHVEIDLLREPVGKQDQYIAAYGGVTCFRLFPNGHVEVTPLRLDRDTLYALEDDLLLFFTGYSRAASDILREQDNRSKQNDREMNANLHFIKDLAYDSREALETGNLRRFAELMNIHWEYKKKRSASMSSDKINEWYDMGRKNGALGGKLIGAGGGGFLMFYAEDRASLRRAMREAGLQEVRFRFDFEGTKLLIQS
jgi:D-glycero-alpha-D-manno-heptose-7-phosphate kinase